MDIRWEYEPVDLDGWIPDFAILRGYGDPIYAEVKAVNDPASPDGIDGMKKMLGNCERGLLLGNEHRAWLIDWHGGLACGFSALRYAVCSGRHKNPMGDACLVWGGDDPGWFTESICGWVSDELHPYVDLESAFATAKNVVQYKAPRDD